MRDKAREKILRLRARESELQLIRALTLNRKAAHYGTYALIEPIRNILVFADRDSGFGMTLDDIEGYLDGITAFGEGRRVGEQSRTDRIDSQFPLSG